MTDIKQVCSFCGKDQDTVKKLIISDTVAICNECVNLCSELLEAPMPHAVLDLGTEKMDPAQLKEYLDQYVIGQEQAKIMLSVAIVNHYKRINCVDPDQEISKANILVLGPTGSGKTLLAQTVARYLDVPFAIADATSLTEAGYVGDDVESLIGRLYDNSGNDIEKTQRGIVFIDEIDKISRKGESTSITRDVSGEGVQQALLKMVEGTTCRIPVGNKRKHPGEDMITINTKNILFIAGGAFVGLDKIIQHRVDGASIGFNSPIVQKQTFHIESVVPDDLIKFGLIPEFIGRFPGVVTLKELDQEDMVRILTEVKNNYIDQYRWLFQQDDVDLQFDDTAIKAIVHRAMLSGTGARALHSEIERALLPHMFHLRQYRDCGVSSVLMTAELVDEPAPLDVH